MRTLLMLAFVAMASCSADVSRAPEREPNKPTIVAADECDHIDDPSVQCARSDGEVGHCALGECVISCNTSADCPNAICRASVCADNACLFTALPNGTECLIGDLQGQCESYVCVVFN